MNVDDISPPFYIDIVLFTGSVEVLVGREGLRFVTGPFSYYGTQSLSKILCYTWHSILLWKLNIVTWLTFCNFN